MAIQSRHGRVPTLARWRVHGNLLLRVHYAAMARLLAERRERGESVEQHYKRDDMVRRAIHGHGMALHAQRLFHFLAAGQNRQRSNLFGCMGVEQCENEGYQRTDMDRENVGGMVSGSAQRLRQNVHDACSDILRHEVRQPAAVGMQQRMQPGLARNLYRRPVPARHAAGYMERNARRHSNGNALRMAAESRSDYERRSSVGVDCRTLATYRKPDEWRNMPSAIRWINESVQSVRAVRVKVLFQDRLPRRAGYGSSNGIIA